MDSKLEKRFDEIEELATKKGPWVKDGVGLDFFPVVFEEVPREMIWEVASYGLPTRMHHWSFGRSYLHQKINGEMGYSKIYELILNNDPSYAFLDESNSDVANLMICAHCLGHSSFFKKNLCFRNTNRNMVNQAARNAHIIDKYREKYGEDEVEAWLDAAFSIERHIDPNKGESRDRYPDMELTYREIPALPYASLYGEDESPSVVEELKNDKIPPHPEKDILWFLTQYSNLLPWQREVMEIVRSESYYFYPQTQTKIANEGWASFWHAEIMLNYDLSASEHIDFSKLHSSVVSPGSPGNANPYYIGYKIFTDIKKRWDEAYSQGIKDKAFMRSDKTDVFDERGRVVMSKLDGYSKMFKVMEEEDDYGLVSNYLTKELCEEMALFTYGHREGDRGTEEDDIVLKSRELDAVREALVARSFNYGVPNIYITKVSGTTMYLQHDKNDPRPLDKKYAEETLKFVNKAWKGTIILDTKNHKGERVTIRDGESSTYGVSSDTQTKRMKFNI